MDPCVCVVVTRKKNRSGTTSNKNTHQFKTLGTWNSGMDKHTSIMTYSIFFPVPLLLHFCNLPRISRNKMIATVISCAAQRACSLQLVCDSKWKKKEIGFQMRKKSFSLLAVWNNVNECFALFPWKSLSRKKQCVIYCLLKRFRLVIIWVYRRNSSKSNGKPLPNRIRSNNKFSVEFSSLGSLVFNTAAEPESLRTLICLSSR